MRGFTLLETILYIALFSFMLTNLFSAMILVHDQANKVRKAAEEFLEALNTRDALDYGIHVL